MHTGMTNTPTDTIVVKVSLQTMDSQPQDPSKSERVVPTIRMYPNWAPKVTIMIEISTILSPCCLNAKFASPEYSSIFTCNPAAVKHTKPNHVPIPATRKPNNPPAIPLCENTYGWFKMPDPIIVFNNKNVVK